MRLSMEEVQKQHESTKKLYEQGLTVAPVDVKRVLDLYDTIEALQQENEQLKDENASLRNWNACEEKLHNELLEEALEGAPDYHNPADVEALRKAREAIQRAKENFEPYGEYEYDVRYDLEEVLAEIDKVIG